MSNSLDGKTIVVTGAASGIGTALAQRLVSLGANVMLADIAADGLAAVADRLDSEHVDSFVADVSIPEDNQQLVQRTVEQFGNIHGAALNVGVPGTFAPIAEADIDMFDRVMSINVRGTWLGLKYLIPEIAKQDNGSIVLTGSTAGFRAGAPNRSAYVTSKHAVIGLMRAAAAECAPLGIRVNSVSPGGVRTPMTMGIMDLVGEEQGQQMLEAFEATIPLKRLAVPEEIADTILFLLGNDSRYCTATNVMVDGGLMG